MPHLNTDQLSRISNDDRLISIDQQMLLSKSSTEMRPIALPVRMTVQILTLLLSPRFPLVYIPQLILCSRLLAVIFQGGTFNALTKAFSAPYDSKLFLMMFLWYRNDGITSK